MIKKLFISILLLLCCYGCKDYSDLVLISRTKKIEVNNPIIEVALVGLEDISGDLTVRLNKQVISETEIKSTLDGSYKKIKLHLLDNKIRRPLSYELVHDKKIHLEFEFIDSENNIKITHSAKLEPIFPPLSNIKKIYENNFSKVYMDDVQGEIEELKNLNLIQDNIERVALLSNYIKNGNILLENFTSNPVVVLKGSKNKVSAKIIVDTVYYFSNIYAYPISNNDFYEDLNLKKLITDFIDERFDSLGGKIYKKTSKGDFILERDMKLEYSLHGNLGWYLINIDSSRNYFIQQFGVIKFDNLKPQFEFYSELEDRLFHSPWKDFNKDPQIQGLFQVLQKNKNYEYDSVSFLGLVNGDIKNVYVNNKKLSFTKGEKFLFKLNISPFRLTKIPVKLVDNLGHVAKFSFQANYSPLLN